MMNTIMSFNHPMVKVKVKGGAERRPTKEGFNHPMVKVKVKICVCR